MRCDRIHRLLYAYEMCSTGWRGMAELGGGTRRIWLAHAELRVNGINRSGRTISSRARRLRFSWDFGRRIDATDQMKTIRFYGVLHTFGHVSERPNVLLVVIFRVFRLGWSGLFSE